MQHVPLAHFLSGGVGGGAPRRLARCYWKRLCCPTCCVVLSVIRYPHCLIYLCFFFWWALLPSSCAAWLDVPRYTQSASLSAAMLDWASLTRRCSWPAYPTDDVTCQSIAALCKRLDSPVVVTQRQMAGLLQPAAALCKRLDSPAVVAQLQMAGFPSQLDSVLAVPAARWLEVGPDGW